MPATEPELADLLAHTQDVDEFNRIADELEQLQDQRLARLAAPQALASAAAWYAAQGVDVFPVQPRDKVPMPGLRWRDKATTDGHQIAAWWRAWPDANIGMPTGLRWDVIDIDGPKGYQSFADLRDDGKLPARLGRSTTPRGGMHVYIAPSGQGNAAGWMPGLDYRGIGGYVLLPPSVGANGRLYLWDQTPMVAP
ncbi:MAG TPA: bifunctional DNA primase/polymerase [Streptomyces sp.]